jgi:diguanylate cyclase (GGDEF)-like protein
MAAIGAGQLPDPAALLLIDVDNFKTINDTCSHDAGDQVLRAIAGILRANCRSDRDIAVRYADDEFTAFLHAGLSDAVDIAERVRAAVGRSDLNYLNLDVPVSISTGVALLAADMTAKELFHAADEQLYRAKRGGRDRVAS